MVTDSKIIEIFTDGACSGNPGVGGWGAILRYGETQKEISGGERETTNNRMEMTAVIMALRALKRPAKVLLTTDSQYVAKGVTEWMANWQKNNWKTADKKPVKNVDLWREMADLLKVHDIKWQWVRGHNGHPENERCDELAREAVAKIKAE